MFTRPSISYEEAQRILHGLLSDAASDSGKPVAIAVVDERGDLVAFGRLDQTPVRSLTIALNKAYTSSRTGETTAHLSARLARVGFDVSAYNDPRFNGLAGGVPLLTTRGVVVGGVGVSGRLPEEDDGLASRWSAYVELTD